MNAVATSKNWVRRAAGVLIGFGPLALLIASLVAGLARGATPPFSGIWLIGVASLVAVLNAYLSFVRPSLFRRRRGSTDCYRNVSGVPFVGTLLLCLGALTGFGAVGSAAVGIVAFVFDTGGSGWFVLARWRDASCWDR